MKLFDCFKAANLRAEMETAAVRLQYLSDAHKTVQEDIALTVRATEKTMSDMSKAQDDKVKQVKSQVVIFCD